MIKLLYLETMQFIIKIEILINRISLRVGQFIRREKPLTEDDIEFIGWIMQHSDLDMIKNCFEDMESGKITKEQCKQQLQKYKNIFSNK